MCRPVEAVVGLESARGANVGSKKVGLYRYARYRISMWEV